jgi:hypothetical protein
LVGNAESRRHEVGAAEGAAGTPVGGVRVDGDERGAGGDQPARERLQSASAMAAPAHRRDPDEGIDHQRSGGQIVQMLRPRVHNIGLRVGERAPVVGHDPMSRLWFAQIRGEQDVLPRRMSPPATDSRGPQPMRYHRQIRAPEAAEAIGREGALPRGGARDRGQGPS